MTCCTGAKDQARNLAAEHDECEAERVAEEKRRRAEEMLEITKAQEEETRWRRLEEEREAVEQALKEEELERQEAARQEKLKREAEEAELERIRYEEYERERQLEEERNRELERQRAEEAAKQDEEKPLLSEEHRFEVDAKKYEDVSTARGVPASELKGRAALRTFCCGLVLLAVLCFFYEERLIAYFRPSPEAPRIIMLISSGHKDDGVYFEKDVADSDRKEYVAYNECKIAHHPTKGYWAISCDDKERCKSLGDSKFPPITGWGCINDEPAPTFNALDSIIAIEPEHEAGEELVNKDFGAIGTRNEKTLYENSNKCQMMYSKKHIAWQIVCPVDDLWTVMYCTPVEDAEPPNGGWTNNIRCGASGNAPAPAPTFTVVDLMSMGDAKAPTTEEVSTMI